MRKLLLLDYYTPHTVVGIIKNLEVHFEKNNIPLLQKLTIYNKTYFKII